MVSLLHRTLLIMQNVLPDAICRLLGCLSGVIDGARPRIAYERARQGRPRDFRPCERGSSSSRSPEAVVTRRMPAQSQPFSGRYLRVVRSPDDIVNYDGKSTLDQFAEVVGLQVVGPIELPAEQVGDRRLAGPGCSRELGCLRQPSLSVRLIRILWIARSRGLCHRLPLDHPEHTFYPQDTNTRSP